MKEDLKIKRKKPTKCQNLMRAGAVAVAVFLFSAPAYANDAIPFVAGSWIGMVLLLIPITIIEAFVLWLRLDISILNAVGAATVANLASTFVGIPISCWLLKRKRPKTVTETEFRKMPRWKQFNELLWDWLWDNPRVKKIDQKLRLWTEIAASFMLLAVFFVGSWLTETVVASGI